MSETIIFRGVYIRSVELRNGDGDRHVRVHLTGDWTGPVREDMDWSELPESFGKADLVGRLAASHMILTPAGRELKRQEVQFACEEVNGFIIVPLKDGEGDVTGRELRFSIRTRAAEACALLEAYCNTVGRGLAQLKVSYVKQENLPLDGGPEVKDDQGITILRGAAAQEHLAKTH